MILPDVSILVYAFREENPRHEECARWLREVADQPGALALSDAVISGFLRVVTNTRISKTPTPMPVALDFVRWLGESPRVHWLSSSPAVWDAFSAFTADDRGIRGPLVSDAYLAALCIAHGAVLATADRDFARFEGLRRIDPS